MKAYHRSQRILLPPEVRQFVFHRDQFRCQSCGRPEIESQLQVDHIVPVAKGGGHDLSNLQTLCKACNQRKRDHLDPRFRQHFS